MKPIIFGLLASLTILSPADAKTVRISALGQIFTLTLPEGMCNITHTGLGREVLSYLEQTNSLDPIIPDPYVVFRDCNLQSQSLSEGAGYPWGYIGLPKTINPQLVDISQQQLNEASRELANSVELAGFFDTLSATIDSKLEESGIDRNVDAFEGYAAVVANDTVFVGYSVISGIMEGQNLTEHVLFSSSIANGIIVNYYITEIDEHADRIALHTQRLVDVADQNAALRE